MSIEADQIVDKLIEKIDELIRENQREIASRQDAEAQAAIARRDLRETQNQLAKSTGAAAEQKAAAAAHEKLWTAARKYIATSSQTAPDEIAGALVALQEAIKASEKFCDEIPF